MPLIFALIAVLIRAVGPIVAQVLLSLGISFIAFTGIDLAVSQFKDLAINALSGTGATFLQFVGVFQIGTAINMLASAYLGRTILMGVTGGKLTKMITKS
jgi:Protein of unknown function (DUF2523)